jgi:hypothetical protein
VGRLKTVCNFLSAIVLKNGDVLHSPLLDSHSELVTLFKLPDTSAHHQHFAKVELTPPAGWDGWADVSKWDFRLDEPTQPGWWADVAQSAEESVRNIIRRAILPAGERDFHLDGLVIIGPGVTVRSMRGGRAYLRGGTLTAMRGGTLTAMSGGTLTAMRGGTLTAMWGGTLTAMTGGALTAMSGGTLTAMWGGTLTEMRGGTLTAMRGGTLTAMWGGTLTAMTGGTLTAMWGGTLEKAEQSPWCSPIILTQVAKGAKLNADARRFIHKPPPKPRAAKKPAAKPKKAKAAK